MGTRRSRHNYGHKPRYKDFRVGLLPAGTDVPHPAEALSAPLILAAGPRYFNGGYYDKNRDWSEQDSAALAILCAANADLDRSAEVLGRPPKTLAHRASDVGLSLPANWARMFRSIRSSAPRIVLAYPYLAKRRLGDADLLAANALVPKGMPEWMRADICQSMMLALFEGTVTIEELQQNKDKVRFFIRKFYREQMPREEVSIETDDDTRPYHDMVDSGSEWRDKDVNDRRLAHDDLRSSFVSSTAPMQIDDIYSREISAAQWVLYQRGGAHSRAETAAILNSDFEWPEQNGKRGPHARTPIHPIQRAADRYGLALSRADLLTLRDACHSQRPVRFNHGDEIHIIKWDGVPLPVIYNRKSSVIRTILPRDAVDEGGQRIVTDDSTFSEYRSARAAAR